ncbi:MAG: class I SAM-dependent methyltransferase [bacterium]|nr:class I SAM-dependent methyltransferase [bacterium]
MCTSSSLGPEAYSRWRASDLGRVTEFLEHRLLLEMLGTVNGQRLLDIGCGDGLFANSLAKKGANVIGIDRNALMIKAAGVRNGPASFLVAEGYALPFEDEMFDAVTLVTVLCLSDCPDAILREIHRVLKPGGRLVIGELGKWSIWALYRRLKGVFGNKLWRNAHFHSKADLYDLLKGTGLRIRRFEGAVYYPPVSFISRLLAPLDHHFFCRFGALGASFFALSAEKNDDVSFSGSMNPKGLFPLQLRGKQTYHSNTDFGSNGSTALLSAIFRC